MRDKEKVIIQHNIKSKTIQLRKINYYFGKYIVKVISEKDTDKVYYFDGLSSAKKCYKRMYKQLKDKI